MPVTKSAQKALRKEKRRRARNRIYKEKMKTLVKETKGLIEEKKTEEARKILPRMYKILDKSAKVGVIKKNTASRKKARITKLLNKLGS